MTPASTKKEGGEPNGDANGTSESLEENLKAKPAPVYCHSCGTDCTRVYYHNAKSLAASGTTKPTPSSKTEICPRCYMNNRFPSSTTSSDYVKFENPTYLSIADKSPPWTDAEVLLLLEGLELFDDNWDSVASHVKSRTREECVLKFLQLEIEDKYVETEDESSSRGQWSWLSDGRIPFAQADNPVLSVLGFLANIADPNVAAAAAGKSVKSIRESVRKQIDGAKAGGGEDVKAESSAPPEAMDVDTADQATSSDPATIALSLTAARASALASHEERHITSLVSAAVNLQLQKMELKMAQFNEMETLLAAERRELERQRQRLFLDRVAFGRRVREVEERFREMGVKEGQGEGKGEKLELGTAAGEGEKEVRPVQEGEKGFRSLEL